ncbi:MAG TPA: hypothetical protein VG897_03610 [Terriglobales bacterium]|nr:hypothetical protein [Terriglobales bacterium]
MRKYILSLFTATALSLFTVMAAAQSPGGATGIDQRDGNSQGNNNNISNSAPQSSAPVTGAPTDPYSVNSGPNGRAANDGGQASSTNGQQTLEGCIVQENTDYFLQPATGDRERLTGSQDLASQVGKHVRLQGSEESSMASAATANSGSTATNQTPNSQPGSSETQNNPAGSIAGNAGSSNATGSAGNGSASSSANGNWTGKDFMVTKVETVSESCPADIQKKIDENKSK